MNGAQEQVDTRAIEIAQEAKVRIQEHEKLCMRADEHRRQEFKELRETISQQHLDLSKKISEQASRLHERINDILGWRMKLASAIISSLLVVIGYLLISGIPWQK